MSLPPCLLVLNNYGSVCNFMYSARKFSPSQLAVVHSELDTTSMCGRYAHVLSYMLQATRDGVEIGAARLDRLDAAANLDSTEAGLNAEARLASFTGLPVLPLYSCLLQLS